MPKLIAQEFVEDIAVCTLGPFATSLRDAAKEKDSELRKGKEDDN